MKVFWFVINILIIASCANPVSPTGGEKDITPPKILNLKIDTTQHYYKINITFDEYIKVKNDIHFNPQKNNEKNIVTEIDKRGIKFQIPIYAKNFTLGKSITDLNENNLGIYPLVYFNNDTNTNKVYLKLPQYLSNNKTSVSAELKQDSLYYRSYTENDTIILNGFPEQENILIFLDKNKNNQYDSTEWFRTNLKDSNLILYPPILSKIELDTTNNNVIAVIPFHLHNDSIITKFIKNERGDTIIFKEKTPIKNIIGSNITQYKKYNLPKQIIQTREILDQDTIIKYSKSIGSMIAETDIPSQYDTLDKTSHTNYITFNLTDSIREIQLIIMDGAKYYTHMTLKENETTITLPEGKYTYTAYIDQNHNIRFDYSDQPDKVIAYFETLIVNKKFKNVINVGKTVKNTSLNSGNNPSNEPISIPLKKGVKQSLSIPR